MLVSNKSATFSRLLHIFACKFFVSNVPMCCVGEHYDNYFFF